MGLLGESLLRQPDGVTRCTLWVALQLVTSRVVLHRAPPDLRSKGSANLDHYRLRLENGLSWGCLIVWGIVALDQTVLTSIVRTLTPQLRVMGTAWGISCFLSIFVLPLLLCMTSGCVSQRSSVLSSSEMISGPERKRYLQVSWVWVGVRLDLLAVLPLSLMLREFFISNSFVRLRDSHCFCSLTSPV